MTTNVTSPTEMTGHPAEAPAPQGAPASAPAEAPAAPAPAAASFTPVYVGARKFESAEELASYTAELENQRIVQSAQVQAPMAPVVDRDKELADLMFQDPTTAIKVLKQEVKQEFDRETAAKDNSARAWASFYQQFPDLKGLEDMVDAQTAKMADRIRKLPLEQAMKELGTAVRGRLASIKGTPSGGVPLSSGPAITAGSSGNPGTPVAVPRQTMSFVEQMASLQKRGKK
jgi:hypothetical protein